MENFDDESNKFGDFTQDSHIADFQWEWGSGHELEGHAPAPPFDHSSFNPDGHFLFIRVSNLSVDDMAFKKDDLDLRQWSMTRMTELIW